MQERTNLDAAIARFNNEVVKEKSPSRACMLYLVIWVSDGFFGVEVFL